MQSRDTELGRHVVLLQKAADLGLLVESHYQFFDGIPVVRRWTRIVNQGREPVGIEHASSAMLYNLAYYGPSDLERKMVVYYAHNSWKCEAQWHAVPPSQLGLSDNAAFNLSGVSLGNVGSWSTMWYLPMGMAENRDLGVILVLADRASRGLALGTFQHGQPHQLSLSGRARRALQPGLEAVAARRVVRNRAGGPGLRQGGFDQAVAALTAYRRKACLRPHRDNRHCPVIFNDYMNCLSGDPDHGKRAPAHRSGRGGRLRVLRDRRRLVCRVATKIGGIRSGLWQPSKTRWSARL